MGAQGSGGSTGSDGAKGQKGELGADGGSGADGSDGDKGQKGDDGSGGTKGQKGEVGNVSAAIPSGGIIMWSGNISAIPSGWYLCDGNNSTPDLRNRFVVGAHSDGADSEWPNLAPDDTGGSNVSSLPSHTHSFSGSSGNTDLGSHKHGSGTYSAGSGGSHVHNMTIGSGSDDNDSDNQRIRAYYPSQNDQTFSGGIQSAGSHSHSVSGDSSNKDLGSHSHSVSGTIGNTGSAGNKSNLPPYYALAYIMKS